ncbi:hypothetical protein J7L06_08300 [Candidatus Bathyarchaeota archaeon]|nr:hypothetical protein [Candidatus Bathyarchaeota archaeon]
MKFEEIVRKILDENKEMTYEELMDLIEGKKREARGYLTDEGAARIVASELGVKLEYSKVKTDLEIDELVSGLSDVTFSGRVLAVYPPKRFKRRDGTEGRYAKLEVGDRKGVVSVVIWNDKVELISSQNIARGDVVKVLHGYVRRGLRGDLEVHLGSKGGLEILPEKQTDNRYPPIEYFNLKIRDLPKRRRKVSLRGFVHQVSDVHEFNRKDGAKGKVRRILLSDETGKLTVVLWNEKVDELRDLKVGDLVQIINGRVKKMNDNSIELHVEKNSIVKVIGNYFEMDPPTIRDLQANLDLDREPKVLGKILSLDEVKEFRRKDGKEGKMARIFLSDGTGILQVNLWDEKTEILRNLKVGDIVLIEGGYITERFGRLSLNLSGYGYIEVKRETEDYKELEGVELKPKKIGKLTREDTLVTVVGRVSSPPQVVEVNVRGERMLLATLEIEDETGRIPFKVWREQAYIVKNLSRGDHIKVKNALVISDPSGGIQLTNIKNTEVEL